ncbi:hypothetical protein GCK72_017390 [Caenorhabditis remanei]|uniref:Uncharacterized protein n=1 Tax=Caenorhabditis remanei TaxID=31234 RepID=A0A6A5G8J6_CAERE|nr:hypothetical protein GCK72_017390 [Caenorhabditis remanei]KAF1750839.1 hypothetical protein GCK72_017390 [Caenorhabditis remanei]
MSDSTHSSTQSSSQSSTNSPTQSSSTHNSLPTTSSGPSSTLQTVAPNPVSQSFTFNGQNFFSGCIGTGNVNGTPTIPSAHYSDLIAVKESEVEEWKNRYNEQTVELDRIKELLATHQDQHRIMEIALAAKSDEFAEMKEMWIAEKQCTEMKERELATMRIQVESIQKKNTDLTVLQQKMEETALKKDSEMQNYETERNQMIKNVDENVQKLEELGRKCEEETRMHTETKKILEMSKQQVRALENLSIEMETGRRRLEDDVETIRNKYNDAKRWIENGKKEIKELQEIVLVRNKLNDKKTEEIHHKQGIINLLGSEKRRLKKRIDELEASRQGRVRRSMRQPIGMEEDNGR